MRKTLASLFVFTLLTSSFLYAGTVQNCYAYPTVTSSGTLVKDCKTYKAIGVNYFDLFSRILKNPDENSSLQGLERLGQAKIPFARFMACGFWPIDWNLYLTDRDQYFSLLDKVVKSAEENNIGLVMDLFWHTSTIPDIVGEPVNAWGDPKSKTIAFMNKYITQVVSRYKNSPAIWMWEFGNEYNLAADLPNAYPHIVPEKGTPETRSDEDKLQTKDIVNAFYIFADTVRKLDKTRLISTGNAMSRPSSYHLAFDGQFITDTEEQIEIMLNVFNQDAFDAFSIHIYPTTLKGYDLNADSPYEQLLSYPAEVASSNHKALFIGEFGACNPGDALEAKEEFGKLLNAVKDLNNTLSALWVYDFKSQPQCTVDFDNNRSYQLDEIIKANKAFGAVQWSPPSLLKQMPAVTCTMP